MRSRSASAGFCSALALRDAEAHGDPCCGAATAHVSGHADGGRFGGSRGQR